MKKCSKCKIEKNIELFSRNRSTSDGFHSQCKDCMKKYYQSEKGKATRSKHMNTDRYKASMVRYAQSEKGKAAFAKSSAKYNVNNPYKKKAQFKVNNALVSGKLINPNKCSKCHNKCRPEAHHDDYNKALEVRWLCISCHKSWHKNNTPIQHQDNQ